MNATTRGALDGERRAASTSARVPSFGRDVARIVRTSCARKSASTASTG